jgi:hypothetical protein
MRLHRLGELIRRRVELIDLDLGTVEPGPEVAHRAVGRKSGIHRLRGIRLVQVLGEVEVSRLGGIGDIDRLAAARACSYVAATTSATGSP